MLGNIQFPNYPFPTPPPDPDKLHCMKKEDREQIWLYHPKRTEGPLLLSLFWAKYPVNVI